MVGPIRDHVAMEQRGDVSQVFDGDGGTRLPKSLEDSGNLECVPHQDGVGYQTQAARLVHDLLVIPGAKFSLVGEKDPACQTMSMLTPIQLQLDTVPQKILDADARKTGFDGLTKPVNPFRNFQGV